MWAGAPDSSYNSSFWTLTNPLLSLCASRQDKHTVFHADLTMTNVLLRCNIQSYAKDIKGMTMGNLTHGRSCLHVQYP